MGSSIPGLSEKRKKEISDRLYHGIYFNKKYREGVKKDFGEILDRGLKLLEVLPDAHTIKEANDRILGERMIDVGELYLNTVKKAEKAQPKMNQYGKYVLYRKGRIYVYSIDNIRRGKVIPRYLIFKHGLPVKTEKEVCRVRQKFDPEGFEKIDWGKVHDRQTDFYKGYFRFWGKFNKSFYSIKIGIWTKRRMYFKATKVV